MPPGMWHLVLTPVGGMTSGGHGLMYDTMHLTYAANLYDDSVHPENTEKRRGEYATNECQAVGRQILRMVLALPFVAHLRSKKLG